MRLASANAAVAPPLVVGMPMVPHLLHPVLPAPPALRALHVRHPGRVLREDAPVSEVPTLLVASPGAGPKLYGRALVPPHGVRDALHLATAAALVAEAEAAAQAAGLALPALHQPRRLAARRAVACLLCHDDSAIVCFDALPAGGTSAQAITQTADHLDAWQTVVNRRLLFAAAGHGQRGAFLEANGAWHLLVHGYAWPRF
mmetsp:Transcript_97694/g.232573  ORF Transcript_97694/g.232573 Transcript_97694/m.232573 type:complete len:201 (+) Transcript_97694:234-836(+)